MSIEEIKNKIKTVLLSLGILSIIVFIFGKIITGLIVIVIVCMYFFAKDVYNTVLEKGTNFYENLIEFLSKKSRGDTDAPNNDIIDEYEKEYSDKLKNEKK